MHTAAIILAAGSSSRMGRSKQMLDIHGETLLIKTTRAVLASGVKPVVVVLGANAEEIRKSLEGFAVEAVTNAEWQQGMGSSIKAGLRHVLEKDPTTERLVILVCDQPMLTAETILNLIRHHRETNKPIIASGYSDVPGVPVLFDKSYFANLAQLPNHHGAKKLILQNPADVVVVPFPGGEIDLDTLEDYDAFRRK